MTVLNLNQDGEKFDYFKSTLNPNTGDIDYEDPVKGSGWVILRPGQPFWEERLATRKKKVEHVLNPKTRQMERISYYQELSPADEKAEREEFWDFCIVDFGGFKDASGTVIKCTKANKAAMMKVHAFERFVTRCFQLMASADAVQKEAETKNS